MALEGKSRLHFVDEVHDELGVLAERLRAEDERQKGFEAQIPATNFKGLDERGNKIREGEQVFDECGVSIRRARNGGKRRGDKDIPPDVREAIALAKGTHKEVAERFGYSVRGVKNVRGPRKLGLSSRFKEQLEEKVAKAKVIAADKMMEAFSHLDFKDQEKLARTSLKDISTILVNMARITETGAERNEGGDRARVIVYAPEVKQLNNYSTVVVED